MNDLKVVLFDLGRVLMHIDFDAFPNGLGLFTKEQRAPYDAPLKPIVRLYEEGKMTTDEFLDSLTVIFDHRFSRTQILEAFNAIIVADNEAILPFVEEVRSSYRIAILSNTCACHWEKVQRVSSIVKIFPHCFTSFRIGAMKPDAAVYRSVCSSLHVLPENVLFIDDLAENISGAQAVGMHGIVFRDPDQLTSDFFPPSIVIRT